eukprot:14645850-Ditylum_brightwellii.AAC.1
MNEAMNTLVMKHAPKIKAYWTSTSLQNCVNIAVGVQAWGFEKFWRAVYGEFGIDVRNSMEKYLCSMDKFRTKHQDYKKETVNKLKCTKANMEKMKIECAKVKKDQEDGRGYGDNKGCNLSSEMISTCVCAQVVQARKITRQPILKS